MVYENESLHNYFDNATNVFKQYNHHVHINYDGVKQDLHDETFYEEDDATQWDDETSNNVDNDVGMLKQNFEFIVKNQLLFNGR